MSPYFTEKMRVCSLNQDFKDNVLAQALLIGRFNSIKKLPSLYSALALQKLKKLHDTNHYHRYALEVSFRAQHWEALTNLQEKRGNVKHVPVCTGHTLTCPSISLFCRQL